MASLTTACRLSARLARSKLPHEAACVRGFRTSTASLAVQNFTMPALSPTMTEGNIASWRVKEGDKFVAGDVLLEIETDKATMDVEAQDDGIMFKILTSDGAKGVPVGARIGVIAEEGDDISTLEVPADEAPKQQAAAPTETKKEEPKTDSIPAEDRTASGDKAAIPSGKAGKASKQTYPLYPSIVQLLHENGLDASKANEIPATGPKGRLLKGDVLVYLGKAKADAAAKGQAVYDRLAHLDLSNIKVAEKKAAPATAEKPAAKKPVVEALQVALPISLKEVIEAQKKVQETLDVFIPLSTFVARAMEVANDELPLPKDYKPSADELFNQVLGLDKVGRQGSRGHYVAQISALPPVPSFAQTTLKASKPDIIDLLAGPVKKQSAKPASRPSGLSTGLNVFSLKVPKAEEKRAKTFLERVKLVLENEPGRLVL
ncbi:pyridoxine biosynthesis protein [Gnomoniopsis smithogilvyi]|uniref:Pyridoxine biosynthesis protein n=1 Tax=Gnomoniopsis smithogilvyi TaxID=1191159 RepID=A0A9W8YU76_9PEZI|nr:pyridoxine biosynthesis protein [Gnomoniopsis smithogilvyi]